MDLMQRRRELMMMGGSDPFANWVKIEFNLTSANANFGIIDGNSSRVPDSALSAIRMIVDGVEITPTRTVSFAAGNHEVLYLINDGQGTNNGWWYWVTSVKRIYFPQSYNTLTSSAIVLTAVQTPEMVFKCPHQPFVAGTTITSNYMKNRKIYVVSGSEGEYTNLGFTDVHSLEELA